MLIINIPYKHPTIQGERMQKGRRKKVRYIQKMPEIVQFSPRGRAGRPNEIELRLDQFEAIKLADLQGYSQSEGAHSMEVSRPTFGRVLREARKVLAQALINGMVIHIRMGNVQVGVKHRNLPTKEELIGTQLSEESIRQKILSFNPTKSAKKAPKQAQKS